MPRIVIPLLGHGAVWLADYLLFQAAASLALGNVLASIPSNSIHVSIGSSW